MDMQARIVDGPFQWGEGPEPSPAENWAFIAAGARTGSNALARMLSLHPDCYIGNEEGSTFALMTIFSSGYYAIIGQEGFIRWGPQFSPAQVRQLCETWREICGGGARIVGDKQAALWCYRDEVRRVFPGCHLVTTIRHPLDQLASACAYNEEIASRSAAGLLDYVCYHADSFAGAQRDETVAVVRFEDLAEGNRRAEVVGDLWRGFGLPVTEELCCRVAAAEFDAPPGAIGRWRTDAHVARVLAAYDVSAQLALCGYGGDR